MMRTSGFVINATGLWCVSWLCAGLVLFNSPAKAQVESDFSAGGGVRIGWSTSVCDGSIEGAIRYNSGSGGAVNFCNGSAWQGIMPDPGLSLNDPNDAHVDYTSKNLFLGHEAPPSLAAGSIGNTSVGLEALDSLRDISAYGNNTAFGYRALTSDDGYSSQTAVGSGALQNHNNAAANTAVGFNAAGTQIGSDGTTAIGWEALRFATDHGNTCVGANCLKNIGYAAHNTALGVDAGSNPMGSFNILIGGNVQVPSPSASYRLNIGDLIYGDMSANKFMGVNNPAPAYTLDVNGDIAYTGVTIDLSDGRLKTDIVDLPPALSRVMALRPVSFTMKNDPGKKTEYGLIAQEVQKIYPVLVEQAADANKTLSMNYVGLIAPLVKAVQERQKSIEDRGARIKALQHKIAP